jgi:bacillithiol biosynthesis deacetylase BshB1
MNMKLDILAFAAHPDDVEISAGGTILVHLKKGYKCGIIDLTQGELGTRGTMKTREEEAKRANEIIGIHVRENLGMEDGFFLNDKMNQLKIVSVIRKYRPEIVLCPAITDRHPDHSRAASLVSSAIFLSGLLKVETIIDDKLQEKWKVKAHYHYLQDRYIKPDFAVDISEVWEKKMQAVKAFSTQFYDPASKEPETVISRKDFFDFLAGRAMEMGRPLGVQYAEGFTTPRSPGISDLFNLI